MKADLTGLISANTNNDPYADSGHNSPTLAKTCQVFHLEREEILTLHQVWELSKLWYHNRLSLEYHGRSIEQVAEVFKQVGLKSEFWYTQKGN